MTTDDHAPGEPCSCSEANAAENHALVIALAERHGVDLCVDPPDEDENDDIADLRLLHSVFLAQGATCDHDDLDDDDEDGMDDDDEASSEFDVSRFSDDEADDDEFDLDGMDDDDDDATFSFDDGATAADPDALHDVAAFDLGTPTDDGEFVRYEGARIFRPGDFPRKSFSMTPEELASAVERFKGAVPAELEHINSAGTATFLDGEFGSLENVRLADDGWMVGDVVLDKWVDRKWDKFLAKAGETRKQVSAVWNRATKDIEKLGLVIRGHVEGAALNAAFSDRDDDSAIDAMFATPRKHHPRMTHAWQAIHDQAAMVPGICPANPLPSDPRSPVVMGDIPKQYKHLKSAHDNSVEHGAACSGRAMMSNTLSGTNSMPDENKTAVTTDKTVAAFTADDYAALRAELEAEKARNAETAARLAETSAAFSATQAQLEAERVKRVAKDAADFALELIRSGRAYAVENEDIVAEFSEAAEADHSLGGTVSFSDAAGTRKDGSRVEKLRARYAKRPSHGLFEPALGDGKLLNNGERILFNDKADAESEVAVRAAADAVLAKTNEGRAVLARRGK